jgi:anti-sigma B factor antagonist
MSGRLAVVFEDEVGVVSLPGEHDIGSSPDLSETIKRLVEGGRDVVVDLSETSFVDSSILRSLVNGAQEADAADVGYVAYLPETPVTVAVRRVVTMTGLETVLPIVTDRVMALDVVRHR